MDCLISAEDAKSLLLLYSEHILPVTSQPWKALLIEVLSFIWHVYPASPFPCFEKRLTEASLKHFQIFVICTCTCTSSMWFWHLFSFLNPSVPSFPFHASTSLITCLKMFVFFPSSASPASESFLSHGWCRTGGISSASLPFYPATELLSFHTPFPEPRLLPYCTGPGRNSHSPVSQPLSPPLHSNHPGAQSTERQKEKKKELHLSVRDYRLPLSSDHARLQSMRSCARKAKRWERQATSCSRWQFWDVSELEKPF